MIRKLPGSGLARVAPLLSRPRYEVFPASTVDNALSLIERLTEMGRPFARVGITGYPESHPRIDDDITIQAMWDKRHHDAYIVSNLCFDAAVLRRWIGRIRARGVTLPLFVGVAGPVDRARLVRMAARAGVAESARFLAGHTEWFLRLGTPAGTARTGCSTAPGPRSPPPPRPWQACTCSPSTRSGRPRSGAGRCSPGWPAGNPASVHNPGHGAPRPGRRFRGYGHRRPGGC